MSDLQKLLAGLRAATADTDALVDVFRASTERLSNDDYRGRLQEEIAAEFSPLVVTYMLTDVGILSDEPLFSGLWRRVGALIAPAPNQALDELTALVDHKTASAIAGLDVHALSEWFGAIDDATTVIDRATWASAMVILATRIAGAGLEARLLERIPSLTQWGSPFVTLSRVVDHFAERYLGDEHHDTIEATVGYIDDCLTQVAEFRLRKQELGTTLHLSSASLRMLQQLRRLRQLVRATDPTSRPMALAHLTRDLARARARSSPTAHFLDEKLELVAYLTVGHAARKGEKYAVWARDEFWGFWRKSAFGGLIVAVFGSAKLHLTFDGLAIAPQGFLYGLNYALCFVLIYVLGASLATKQPAFTASRLAESLEDGPEHESFPELVRAIWRSQFVSFLGNIVGAALCSFLLVVAYVEITGREFINPEESVHLLKKMHPLQSASIWYAAVAGVLLSLSGFLAGFVDNAIVFHRVADRVRARRGVFAVLLRSLAEPVAERVDQKSGAIASNAALGFMLGAAGGLGVILGLPFDIRHVAFASSHTAIALYYSPDVSPQTVGIAGAAVAIIGFVNFVVSFGLTLAVAVQARRVAGTEWRSGFRGVARLFRRDPMGFLLPTPPRGSPQ